MIRLENVTKTYRTRRGPVNALDNVSIEVARGEFVVVRGPSGCGKSTLLLMIGGMLRPSSGAVLLDDADVYALSQRERNRLRATRVGFVFQMFHLVPYLTVIENVLLPNARAVGRDRALALLEQLGLADRALHRPGELSAGEKQRAALARAPTGNLDPENAAGVFGHLADYHKSGGTVVVVTHGGDGDVHADRVICLRAGCIEA